MRKLFSLLAAVLFAGSMMAAVISITPESGFKSSYGEGTITVDGVELAYSGLCYNQKNNPSGFAVKQFIQFRRSSNGAGVLNNKASMSLKSITIATQNNAAFTLSAGTAANALTEVTKPTGTTLKYQCKDNNNNDKIIDVTVYKFDLSEKNYFQILNGSSAAYIAYINIEYQDAYCEVYDDNDDDDFDDYVRADLITDAFESKGAVYYVLLTNPAWSATELAAALQNETGMATSGAALLIGFYPESLKNFTGEYDIDDNNLVILFYQYDKTTDQWKEKEEEIEVGLIEIAVNEDGDSYDMAYEFTVANKDVEGTMYGLCADEIDIDHLYDVQDEGFEYKNFIYDPEDDVDVEGGAEVGYDLIAVSGLDEEEGYMINLGFIVTHSENPQLTAGTYTIKSVKTAADFANQIVAAGYWDYDEDDVIFSAAYESDGAGGAYVWYLVSGNVVVDAAGTITVNAKNSFDQDIKAKLVKDPGTGIQNTELENAPVKAIENGQFIIKRNGARFNAIGAQLR